MTEFDAEGLEAVRAWAQRQIEAEDRRRSLAPLWDAMQKTFAATQAEVIPGIMVGPEAQVRRSVLKMEENQSALPAKLAQRERESAAQLARLRARTAELRLWLKALA